MAKRVATEQLTAASWDRDEFEEEDSPGLFLKATSEQLKERPMKKAVRKGGLVGDKDKPGGLFAGVKLGVEQKVSTDYLSHLRSLNMSVVEWISEHVSQNPYIDLSPVFHDYSKHLDSITQSSPCTINSMHPTTTGNLADQVDPASSSREPVISSDSARDQLNTKMIAEMCDGDLMAVRCKLFYKKNSEYVELGVGVLHVEQLAEGSGIRLLLRNDTALGKVLLNIRLNPQQPISVQKNNLLVVSIPNPPLTVAYNDERPVTYLLRVKTNEIANNLLTTIHGNLQ